MKIFSGLYDLVTNPVSLYALITLAIVGVVSWHTNSVMALAALATATPAMLVYCNHKISLAQMAQDASPPAPTNSTIESPRGVL
jgi:hypothetical protein